MSWLLILSLCLNFALILCLYFVNRHRDLYTKEVTPSAASNTGSLKLPTLEECIQSVVNMDNEDEKIRRDSAVTKRCYDFICRQLQASA